MRALLLVAVLGACAGGGCGSAPGPSDQAVMVCAPDAQRAIAASLRLRPTRPVVGVWAHGTYSCGYAYHDGTVGVSVRDFATAAGTKGYLQRLESAYGRRPDPVALGTGSFITRDGSLVVNKDNHVLMVDVSKLPQVFGVVPSDRTETGILVAEAIMRCWTGD